MIQRHPCFNFVFCSVGTARTSRARALGPRAPWAASVQPATWHPAENILSSRRKHVVQLGVHANPWLYQKYDAHLNVEVVASVKAVKHVFKIPKDSNAASSTQYIHIHRKIEVFQSSVGSSKLNK